VHAFGSIFDLQVTRASAGRLSVEILRRDFPRRSYIVRPGETAIVTLK
jgi:hypothetical protein